MACQPYAWRSLQQAAPIRHSSAADLRRAGADVADIQAHYGHTRPEAAMIYRPLEWRGVWRRLNGCAGTPRRVAPNRLASPFGWHVRLAERRGVRLNDCK